MRQIFLDTETTGLSPDSGDKVIEIGCVEYVARKPTGRSWHHYVDPGRPNNPEAFAVHGISDEFLRGKPRFAELADDLLAFLSDAELVIHNAPFDMGFLDAEFLQAGHTRPLSPRVRVTDSLKMAKLLWPGKRNGLDALCDRLGVDNSSRTLHGALLDAQLLAEVYIGMTRGQDALAIDAREEQSVRRAEDLIDLDGVDLEVLYANPEELVSHGLLLQDMEMANGKPVVWARIDQVSESN